MNEQTNLTGYTDIAAIHDTPLLLKLSDSESWKAAPRSNMENSRNSVDQAELGDWAKCEVSEGGNPHWKWSFWSYGQG